MSKLILLFTGLFISMLTVAQTTVLIPASADNTIYEFPESNSNAIGENFFSGNNGGLSPRRALIKFDIAAVVPAGATITSASLTLNCNTNRPVDNIDLHKVTNNWGEGTSKAGNGGSGGDGSGVPATTNDATWLTNFFGSSNWLTPGGDFVASSSATFPVSATGYYSWQSAGMVNDVQAWLTTPAENYGWILICNESIGSTARRFASRENTVVANRPSLSVTYTNVVPVKLISFTAVAVQNKVELDWATALEINNSHFEILCSTDGLSFSKIALIKAANLSAGSHYHFQDRAKTAGSYYYKLKQVDVDGNFTFSEVRKVSIIAEQNLRISPNPVGNALYLLDVNYQNSKYSITDAAGKIITRGALTQRIELPVMAKGIYFLNVTDDNNQTKSVPFLKN